MVPRCWSTIIYFRSSFQLGTMNNLETKKTPLNRYERAERRREYHKRWQRRKRGVKRKRPINIPEYAEDFSGDEYNDITEKVNNFGESENNSDESCSPYSKINTHTMDSCICYSTYNDTEQHSTYCAADLNFLHTQQCHTTIWQCQIFFRPALSDRRKIPWQWCWFVTSIDVYIFTTNHGASYGSFGLCKVTARWPDLTHLSVHSLVNGVRSTRTSFLVRVIGSTATTVRKVSEVTKEMKLHDYD